MDEVKYLFCCGELIKEDTIAIFTCQFEVCNLKCALDELFHIKINESGISISNTFEGDKCCAKDPAQVNHNC